jgi:CheY-like chemotaxis protein
VLVIDDDDGIRRVVNRSLNAYDVVTAGDGRQALAILATDSDFDLLLCDVVMPGMGGVEFWGELAAAHPDLVGRIVFMTGGAQTEEEEKFLASGVVEVLRKPFSFDALRRIVVARVDERRG